MIQYNNLPKSLKSSSVKEKLQNICEENGITLMALFGSFVRGEQNNKSDIDLAIEFQKNSRKTLFDLVRLEYEMKKIFKRKVDIGPLRSINPHIINHVKKEMKIIYEKG